MQPLHYLRGWLEDNANNDHYIFSKYDLRTLFPLLSEGAFKTLLSRAASAFLMRVCRGLYIYRKAAPLDGLLLFHIASYLRSSEFNYISLETALSDQGIISQVQINWITIMTSGRSNVISCKEFGTIEFIHTTRKPTTRLSV
jgi:predicted transcriptional regulator of viral defense system